MTATDINVEWEIYGLLLMRIKTFFIFVFFGSVSILSNADFSIDRPIWDQVDELICVGKSRLDCS
jgi:hypothetical protein